MSPLESRALELLLRYMSEPAARGVLRRARLRRPTGARVTRASADPFIEELVFGARLFVDAKSREHLEREVRRLTVEVETLPDHTREELPVCDEHQARRARMAARRLAETAGASKLDSLRAATGLSELTRNILMYAGSGEVVVEILDAPRRIRMVASDRGPGIGNLDEVLGGEYQSKTGLGRGLLGTKRLADHFEISTGPQGTTVTFEMKL